MKFMVEYLVHDERPEWTDPDTLTAFAVTAEESGFDAVAFGEHPAPSTRWLRGGGNWHVDPFVGMAFAAAVTREIGLVTKVVDLPYRNPMMLAKLIGDVDVLARGRTTFVFGAGYHRAEFGALGVDFDERNALFDEAIEVLDGVWTTDEYAYTGRHFRARGQYLWPRPVQRPRPPFWVAGNSTTARERAARFAQGWASLRADAAMAQVTRTPAIESEETLAAMLRDLHRRVEAHGRQPGELDVLAGGVTLPIGPADQPDECVDEIARLSALGVTWYQVVVPHDDAAATLDGIRRFGSEVIARVRTRSA